MGFFDFLKEEVPSASPGDLLWLACDISNLMERMGEEPQGSAKHDSLAATIFRHRTALARSMPGTDLDLLMLVFTARQAIWFLQTVDLSTLDESRRKYWTGEISDALTRMQCLLEKRCGTTTDELDLNFTGGPVRKGS